MLSKTVSMLVASNEFHRYQIILSNYFESIQIEFDLINLKKWYKIDSIYRSIEFDIDTDQIDWIILISFDDYRYRIDG